MKLYMVADGKIYDVVGEKHYYYLYRVGAGNEQRAYKTAEGDYFFILGKVYPPWVGPVPPSAPPEPDIKAKIQYEDIYED